MGLRELKAERTRSEILGAALSLFEERGYDATTMEQIAERAFVSPSTLYRYFPTKERTLLDHSVLTQVRLEAAFRSRPLDEELPDALGAALHEFLQYLDENQVTMSRLRRQMDAVPVIRGLVWDSWYREHTALQEAIADRTGTDSDDLVARLSAGVTLMVAQMALDETRAGAGKPSATDFADQIMELLGHAAIPFVRLPVA